MTTGAPPRFPWRIYAIILVVLLVFTLGPLGSIVFTSLVADAADCTVTEAMQQPCIIFGTDFGGLLYFTGMMGWLMLFTIPFGGGAVVVLLVVAPIHFLAWHSRKANPL